MSLKPLINNQTIIIDDHKRGAKEVKNWDNLASDIHLDKTTKYRIDGKTQNVKIRLPLNSNRDISVEIKEDRKKAVPTKLRKEIRKAFENKEKRDQFVRDLIPILENFSSILDSKENASATLKRIAKHFDLDWNTQEITNIVENVLIEYTQIYQDDLGQYYFTINESRIKISNVDMWYRIRNNIRRMEKE